MAVRPQPPRQPPRPRRKAAVLLPCLALALATGNALLAERRGGRRAAAGPRGLGFIGWPGGDPSPEDEAQQQREEDWKQEAMKRQKERIAWRQKKASPDYVMSPEEKAKRRSKELMWNAASRRGVESTYGQAERETIEVFLEKPMGIEFAQTGEGGAIMIRDIAQGYSAASSGLVPGDVLSAVAGEKVEGRTMEEALNPIKEATGPVKLTFLRLV
eukprot:CAMPEP_0204594534 /NCGR_PEP_ID=MMETSP0661-20131031/52134_1 /ASSEMBLY_ACC=CAM_ASM_000606 /TAXON_ID=109239 /ORGANISM="Alexandrium margalefi, Strain AMGDE01CS-322" /LENGTH=214 /DNA_ID=CAMNT_0051604943 /DNA_START=60 /DNA_END=704 /DNA_ORIENTATION=+